MAKTTPSGRAKSKTKAPKKKPTQLDRIEKKLDTIHRTVVVRADSIHATLVDTKRSIGSIESKLSTLNAWEMLNEAMSEAKLASPTVAVEEKWVPKVNELVVSHGLDQHVNAKSYAGVGVVKSVFKTHWHVRWPSSTVSEHSVATTRPATSEEIAAHEAKLKAEAQAAEDAKLVFGARVKMVTSSREGFLMGPMCDADNDYRVAIDPENGFAQVVYAQRNEFTLLP